MNLFSYAELKRFSMTHRAAEEVFIGENIWRTSTTPQADYWQIPFVSSSYNYRDVINQSKYPYYASKKGNTLIIPFTAEETPRSSRRSMTLLLPTSTPGLLPISIPARRPSPRMRS